MNEKRFEDFHVTPSPLPNEGLMFVNHEPRGRGGHLGHALAECPDGQLLAFYPDCDSGNHGHSGNGYMAFKRSHDHGMTWEPPEKLAYSYDMWASGCGRTAMCEKAVVTDAGTIVLFHLICDMRVNGAIWEPYFVPTYTRSEDMGHTWSDAAPLCALRGRVYDALEHGGVIYALMFANDAVINYTGVLPQHQYLLYESRDDGKTFSLLSTLSIPSYGRCYGTMEFLENGDLIVYVYDEADEAHPDFCVSRDGGRTWDAPGKAYMAKNIRNPQMIRFGGGYFMHGRSGSNGSEAGHFVVYYSIDGYTWDEGHYFRMRGPGAGGYSNSIVVGGKCGGIKPRLLIQTSYPYREDLTNIIYWWVDQA